MAISMRTFGSAAMGTLLALAAMLSITAAQASVEVNINDGAAVHGYDVVAYFTEGRPVRGDAAYTAEHEGAIVDVDFHRATPKRTAGPGGSVDQATVTGDPS